MSPPEYVGSQHHHGCVDCGRRYVCACHSPQVDETCISCLRGELSRTAIAWDPQPCCYASSPLSPMTKDERRSYKLAGSTQWFKCPVCARQFPRQPEQVRTS